MIDTVQFRLPVPPSLPLGDLLNRAAFIRKRGARATWVLHIPSPGLTLPRITVSETLSGVWMSVEVSMPKMLFGNNVVMLNETDAARGIAGVSRFITEVSGFEFNAAAAPLAKVAYCHNFMVGEANVRPYVDAAATAVISRMLRAKYNDTTTTFSNAGLTISAYGKHAEVVHQARKGKATDEEMRAAEGVLRLEVTPRSSKSVLRLAKRRGIAGGRAADLLTRKVARAELSRALVQLGMDKPIPAADARLNLLLASTGGGAQYFTLSGFLMNLDRYGAGCWRDPQLRLSKATYYRHAAA